MCSLCCFYANFYAVLCCFCVVNSIEKQYRKSIHLFIFDFFVQRIVLLIVLFVLKISIENITNSMKKEKGATAYCFRT